MASSYDPVTPMPSGQASFAPVTEDAVRSRSAGGGRTGLLCATAALALLTVPAQAQTTAGTNDQRGAAIVKEADPAADRSGERDPQRVDEAFQPKGIEIGQFLLFPQIEVTQSYNTNVFAASTDVRGDFITRVVPEFRLRSRFPVHELNLLARADQFFYWEYTDDNHLDATFQADGRYDFTREWEARATVDVSQLFEDRGSPDAVGGQSPTRSRSVTGNLETKAQLGLWTVSAEAGAARRVFRDVEAANGQIINNDDRDRDEFRVGGRVGYEVSRGYAAIAAASANWRDYDDAVDDQGFNRSSDGYRIEGGIGIDISQLIRGDFLVGYFEQDYEDARLQNPEGLSLRASFNWTPSRLTVVVPSLERSVQETTTLNASGLVRTAANILVRHELARNVVLTATGSIGREDFDGAGQRNWTYEGRLRAIWALAPEYFVGGEIGYRERTSNIASSAFDQTVVLVRFGLRM